MKITLCSSSLYCARVCLRLIFAGLILSSPVYGQAVVINEIMASNGSTVADEDGDFSDWVELYNPGSSAVDLSGWGFSDRVDNPFKWSIGSAVIPAQGRLLIWASGKDRAGPDSLHASFSISADGEPIILTQPDGTTVDMVPAVPIPRDVSYGRYPDGGADLVYFDEPTPLQPNTSPATEILLEAPEFSHRRGFYEAAFDLVISHPDPNVSIYYTLDGSKPDVDSGMIYTDPISIESSTVVRAVAERENTVSAQGVTTSTYLFLDDVIARNFEAPEGYPSSWDWGNFDHVSYGMSPAVMDLPGYEERMREALKHIPSVSIVVPKDDLFGSDGIYSNPTRRVADHGEQWEKAASMEWLDPTSGEEFEVGVGLRIQGAGSRGVDSTPKKSFRVLFKRDYGNEGRLNQPVLGSVGSTIDDYNTLIFRAEYNNSWLHWASEQREAPQFGLYLVDQWLKDRQIAMSGIGSHGRHVHLFLNGMYWGLYTLAERPDAAWAASNMGGEREDYDALGWRGMRDGDWDRWRAEIEAAVFSGVADNENYLALQDYLDVDHFIDYNLIQMFSGNQDWPRNNWTAVRNREDGRVYHITWDSERSFEGLDHNVVENAWDPLRVMGDPPSFFGVLRFNEEFRLRFADRVRKHLFNGGALTPEVTVPDFASVAERARPAIFAEEARWGAYRTEIRERRSPSYYYGVESHWDPALEYLLEDYLPNRTEVLIGQLRDAGLYPSVDAPDFAQHGGGFASGGSLVIENPNGSGIVYFTTDGSDPRVFGTGEVSPSAESYSSALSLQGSMLVRARTLDGDTWSALTEASFFPEGAFTFLPGEGADWTEGSNWDEGDFPNGIDTTANIAAPSPESNRNIDIRSPVTVGQIRFDQGDSEVRNRIRDRDSGNTLTFARSSGNARIEVHGTGTGFVEFEVDAGVFLNSDLVLDVQNPDGDPDHGALRLRQGWFGPGGLVKTGPGRASLTGTHKHFTGAIAIHEGALQITEPSTTRFSSGISVVDGGQLRLISGSGGNDTRLYSFGGPIALGGGGIDSGLPAGEQRGLLGALRYDPGVNDNLAILTNAVEFTDPASIHVDGTRNTLELTGRLSGAFGFSKSGGGTLVLSGGQSSYTGPISVANGRLQINGSLGSAVSAGASGVITGNGKVGALSGSGDLILDSGTLHAADVDGLFHSYILRESGSVSQLDIPGMNNAVLRVDALPVNVGSISLYVADDSLGTGSSGTVTYWGGLFVPVSADLEGFLNTNEVRVYLPDESGNHEFRGKTWARSTDAVLLVGEGEALFDDGYVQGKSIGVTISEPETNYTEWRDIQFPDPADQDDPAISGPHATPLGDGISNLQRYALGLSWDEDPSGLLPTVGMRDGLPEVSFFYRKSRVDLRYRVVLSEDLLEWDTLLFDSSEVGLPEDLLGWLSVVDADYDEQDDVRFYKVETGFLDGLEP